LSGDSLALDQQPQQQVLGPHVVVTHPPRFLEGDLDDLLDPRGRDDLLDDDALVPAQDALDRLANRRGLHAQVAQSLIGEAFLVAEQAQQEVLRADV
jgi:hypothetical protein